MTEEDLRKALEMADWMDRENWLDRDATTTMRTLVETVRKLKEEVFELETTIEEMETDASLAMYNMAAAGM